MTPSLYAGFDSLRSLSPVSENSQQFETSALKLWVANSQSCRKDARTNSLAVIPALIAGPLILAAHSALVHSGTVHTAALKRTTHVATFRAVRQPCHGHESGSERRTGKCPVVSRTSRWTRMRRSREPHNRQPAARLFKSPTSAASTTITNGAPPDHPLPPPPERRTHPSSNRCAPLSAAVPTGVCGSGSGASEDLVSGR